VLAVSELATNAVRHSGSGDKDGTFTVTVRMSRRWARVDVTDAGPALAPSELVNGWG
jgi:anti-sigma regulatory factor (Ser/Thr protein kinase)